MVKVGLCKKKYPLIKVSPDWPSSVAVNKDFPFPKTVVWSDYLLGNNYAHSTHLLLNKYPLHEISTLHEILSSVVFPNLNTLGSSIFLGKMYSLVKPIYWNKGKQLLTGIF